ncbi:hypothetical protein E2C01_043697 [Portunus trituberculatus]|uniref:Uncharacterized protein n=1 Tax=Portunus trituberculatus TaxID=210409 RepID=A0A5B7FTM3_PORTR|nr:hypothetical protein [Portunus trituberculatus]
MGTSSVTSTTPTPLTSLPFHVPPPRLSRPPGPPLRAARCRARDVTADTLRGPNMQMDSQAACGFRQLWP